MLDKSPPPHDFDHQKEAERKKKFAEYLESLRQSWLERSEKAKRDRLIEKAKAEANKREANKKFHSVKDE